MKMTCELPFMVGIGVMKDIGVNVAFYGGAGVAGRFMIAEG